MICHSTDASAHVAARVLSHTTETAWSKFCLQRKSCEDARNLCATACPIYCTKSCPLLPSWDRCALVQLLEPCEPNASHVAS